MKKNPARILIAALFMLACSVAIVPYMTAATCDHPEMPKAEFSMKYADGSPTVYIDGHNLSVEGKKTIICTDESIAPPGQPIVSWHWDFGDGHISTLQNPQHTFGEWDFYSVSLTVTTTCGDGYYDRKYRFVRTQCLNPVAGFKSDVYEGPVPLTVHITDTSTDTTTGTTTWAYMFEGTSKSHSRNPTYTYNTPGVYTITQTVDKPCAWRYNPNTTTRQIRVTPKVASSVNFSGIAPPTTTTTTTRTTTPSAAVVTSTTSASVHQTITTTTVPVPVASVVLYQATAPVTALTTPVAGTSTTAPVQNTPGTGTLSVATNPAGAHVFVDDVLRGLSPTTIPELSAGSHTLRLEKNGYRNMTVPVSIGDGRTTNYSTALDAESGSTGMLLLIAGVLVILTLVGAGAYLYMKKKAP
jgi:PKD repeat protein